MNAIPSSAFAAREPLARRSIDDLDAAICRLAQHINATNYQLLVLVREFDDLFGWAKWSFASCAEWLAWRCGLSLSAAREKVRTAHALRDQTAIASAFADGRLSYSKVRALTRVAGDHDEHALLAYALDATAAQVEERCRQIRNVRPDSVQEAKRAWRGRSLSIWRNRERQTLVIHVELPLAEGEVVAKALDDAIENGEVATGVEQADMAWQSQQADALVAIAKRYLAAGACSAEGDSSSVADHYQLVVHVDESALRGGIGRADLPIDTIKRLACDTNVVVVTEDDRGHPLNIGRKQRLVSTTLRRALWARDRGCSFPGCHRARFVDAHHVRHWADGGETSLDNLTLLCSYHHGLLHEGGYRLRRDADSELYFLRPDGRAIPRGGYEPDWTGEKELDPSSEECTISAPLHPSAEVRETRGVYRLANRDLQRARCGILGRRSREPSESFRRQPCN